MPGRTAHQLGDVVQSIFMGIVIARQQKTGSRMARVRVAGVKNIEDGILSPKNVLDELSLPENSQIDRFRLREGDILLSARGSMKVAVVRAEHERCIAGPNLVVIRPGSNLQPLLVLAFLRHPLTQEIIYRKSVTTTVSSINVKTLASLEIVVPSKQDQISLSRIVHLAEKQFVLARRVSDLRRRLGQELAVRALIL
jgi:restriction endonuclease S subunit